MKKVLETDFFSGSSQIVARLLLGKYLVRKIDGVKVAKMVTEVEAYGGREDLASHARFGVTKRNEVMFGEPGVIYVYFIYGIYYMLNVVCGFINEPSAVLVRGLEGLPGPGILTRELKIDKSLSGILAEPKAGLWFEDRGVIVGRKDIKVSKRIGVDYAGQWSEKLWNFKLSGSLRRTL